MTETLILILKWELALLPIAFLAGLTYAAFTTPLPERRKGRA